LCCGGISEEKDYERGRGRKLVVFSRKGIGGVGEADRATEREATVFIPPPSALIPRSSLLLS